MAAATDILVGVGTVVGIVWLAVFICALCDKIDGRGRRRDTEVEEIEVDEPGSESARGWSRKGIARLPVVTILLVLGIAIAVLLMPMWLVEVIWPERPQHPDGSDSETSGKETE